jgi:dolichol-phosphate mannosyltransferase
MLSVVVPIFSEASVINEFYSRIKGMFDSLKNKIKYEIIFVNDGSRDDSLNLLKALNKKDSSIKIINFSRNFGHQIAITAGIDRAKGDCIVTMDGDLQDPPEVIPEMIEKWNTGYKVVYGVRKKRKGEGAFKIITANVFYRILNLMSNLKIPVDSGDFRLMDREVVDRLKTLKEGNRYVRGLVAWLGFPRIGVYYERDPRYAGKPKYSIRNSLRLSLNGITSFSEKPLNFSSYAGYLIVLSSFTFALWLIASKMANPGFVIEGWVPIIVVVLFLGGVQLISIGILGQYVARIYSEVRCRPLYIVQEETGF